MADRSHLSIGEVLSLLQDDFPDVTISKIRFLESQGLLDPERTPSGYRKFYEPDIERLRWILRHQRDHFLPLKVIKERLEAADAAGLPVPPDEPAPPPPVAEPTGDAPAPAPEVRRSSRPAPPLPSLPATPADNGLDPGPSGVSLTKEELAQASGLEPAALDELARYGLLVGEQVGGDTYFDGEALVVARAAAGFMRFGIEARHLRMYKVAAEREAGFMEQVIMPLLKQRNPTARQQAAQNLGEMAHLGEQLRGALLRSALRGHTDRAR